ncbi:DUF6338 family protein [Halobacterium sp. KA-4]|uniref:DUF6338 family protein n=1 Tax=Halobacterium sp. KA-4 TaxID=2896367 RepID=UPI001E6281C2|nr:DUF6338 family protein [Halobacterium sp. KA-4]MCD2201250.1 DUF6338 family protein [Halobacterium sp. KA-4]
MPSHTSGTQLIFFLYLLVPGYFAFRTYLWANIALDETSRLTKIVHMSMGGFGSLAVVAVIRNLGLLHFDFIPLWLAVNEPITFEGVSTLTVAEATNLIVMQSFVAVLGGILVGSLRIIVWEGETKERKNLNNPWEEFEYQATYDGTVTVLTENDEQITGQLLEVGNSSTENDILLTEPRESQFFNGELEEGESRGKISYHHQRDISRVILHSEWEGHERGSIERYHRDLLNSGLKTRSWILRRFQWVQSTVSGFKEAISSVLHNDEQQDGLDIEDEVSLSDTSDGESRESGDE